MKAHTKLAIGMVIAILAVLIASQSSTHSTEAQKLKRDRMKVKRGEDLEKAKLKSKQEAVRDLSSGSENIR